MTSHAYSQGRQDALNLYKVAKYLSEEDQLERKMQRHMSADPAKEKERLTSKGREQGTSTGKVLGTIGGGVGGGAAGTALGAILGRPGLGGVMGTLGGGALGHWGGGALGGSIGADSGAAEFGHREEFAGRLRNLDPQTQRARIESLLRSQREAEQLQLARDNDMREDMRDINGYMDRE